MLLEVRSGMCAVHRAQLIGMISCHVSLQKLREGRVKVMTMIHNVTFEEGMTVVVGGQNERVF